jgi:hypothetical protein
MSAEFAQACDFMFATLKWFTPVPGLGPELCHDRGLASPHPRDCVGVTVALGVTSVFWGSSFNDGTTHTARDPL